MFFRSKRPPFWQSAAAYKLGDQVLVSPFARTKDGVRTGMAEIAISSVEDATEIGRSVLFMLERCRDNVPDDYDRGPSPSVGKILEVSKQRSWSVFHKKAALVLLHRDIGSTQITITPTRRSGGGSDHLDQKALVCGLDPEEIGQSVITAFSLTE